jgi:uncharacterized protein
MQKEIILRLLPEEASNNLIVNKYIAESCHVSLTAVNGYYITKHSIDARSRKQVWINLTVHAFINEPFRERSLPQFHFQEVSKAAKSVIIVGAGPAGLFAALQLVEKGIKPIIVERGKEVRARRKDLALLNKDGILNEDSNYCFGEGGAGTYSDGKLYTRSSKRGSINRILELFVHFGADEKILYQSHPHIGTNKLPHIITAIRETLIDYGAEFYFENRVTDFTIKDNCIKGVTTHTGLTLDANAVILATGHSARDIFELLHKKNILIEAKPFALGVRIEHPQTIIDAIQYHQPVRSGHLPPSSYSLVEQVDGCGVFSFCMCPGGIIAPAATSPNELVVNGWSPSKRNNPYANSGMVVSVEIEEVIKYFKHTPSVQNQSDNPLLLMHFQQAIERAAYTAGGGNFKAPAQRMVDFCNNKVSTNLPDCSYHPGLNAYQLSEVLPGFISNALQKGLKQFGNKMKGYYTNEAVVVATESRTSSPIRIPRDNITLQHPQIKGLYPCGEGAGYAGGIVSAAMDGEKIALSIAG